jgi:hypothetical protein
MEIKIAATKLIRKNILNKQYGKCRVFTCKQPESYAIRYKNIRIAHPRKFPYNIHFYVADNTIVITAILFEGRDPSINPKRLK